MTCTRRSSLPTSPAGQDPPLTPLDLAQSCTLWPERARSLCETLVGEERCCCSCESGCCASSDLFSLYVSLDRVLFSSFSRSLSLYLSLVRARVHSLYLPLFPLWLTRSLSTPPPHTRTLGTDQDPANPVTACCLQTFSFSLSLPLTHSYSMSPTTSRAVSSPQTLHPGAGLSAPTTIRRMPRRRQRRAASRPSCRLLRLRTLDPLPCTRSPEP